MNQHLGASYGLSVLIVVVFAVAFFKADPPAAAPRPPGSVALAERIAPPPPFREPAPRRPGPISRRSSPTDAPASRPVVAVASSSPRVDPPPIRPAGPGPAARPVSIARATEPLPAARPTAGRVPATAPKAAKGPFATVEPGETLADVAARVYGTTDRVDDLWRSNRDGLPSRDDGPLPAGMLLRTP